MAWSRILGHDGVVARFRETLERGRMSHAYLFVGPDGVGKELFARELAKAEQCARGGAEACDACAACHKVEHGNHPDVAFIRRGDGSGKRERRAQILIDQVRDEIQAPIGFKALEGRHKVFVVAEAERMTEEAENALLKTLEEPPPHSLLLLLASRREPMVGTVISRCQVVRFRPLATEHVERILVERHAMDPAEARVLARLCEGSPGRALRCQSDGSLVTFTRRLQRFTAHNFPVDDERDDEVTVVSVGGWRLAHPDDLCGGDPT